MCSLFWQRMENDQGDLADIVRASGGDSNNSGSGTMNNSSAIDWQLPPEHMNFAFTIEGPGGSFGDPFSHMQDPLLSHELDMSGSVSLDRLDSPGLVKMIGEEDESVSNQILGKEIKGPCNMFSRMLQISPILKPSVLPHNINPPPVMASPREIKASSLDAGDMTKSSNATCLIENGALQIPSPRNQGIKRRKSQTKKVVCIPAPAAASNRPSGEVIPSDHWAWRKYGQKPIKGSPYPRGYYRCSSSKGCSARKQVERSRNDPNMLVITYTSEHNHPWPTQRNALAGSTRNQPTKKDSASKSSGSSTCTSQASKCSMPKEETKEMEKDNASSFIAGGPSSIKKDPIKEEIGQLELSLMEVRDCEIGGSQDFNNESSYNKQRQLDSTQSEDFFAELGELESVPLDIMFSQGFTAEKSEGLQGSKEEDPFSLFDWSDSSFGEAGKGL